MDQIAAEWDALAIERHEQVSGGLDLSLDQVVLPAMLRLARPIRGRVLDVGCGVGAATRRLAHGVAEVVAIDPSPQCISVAKHHFPGPRIDYRVSSVEELAEDPSEFFDLVVANMMLMDVPSLDDAIRAIASLLSPDGRGVFTITHPWFWPMYWNYADAEWFDYQSEIFIEAEFTISRARTQHVTTHVHRPLGQYAETLERHGLTIRSLLEPMPSAEDAPEFPGTWRYPRFLAGSFGRVASRGGRRGTL